MHHRHHRDNDQRRDQRQGFDQEQRGRFDEQRGQQGQGMSDYSRDMSPRHDQDRGDTAWGDERDRRYDQEGRSHGQQWVRDRGEPEYGNRGPEGRGYERQMGNRSYGGDVRQGYPQNRTFEGW